MIGNRRSPNPAQADAQIIAEFSKLPVANISDNLERLSGATGIRAFHNGTVMAGTAITVRTRASDNRAIHEILEMVRLGDVIVVDGGGDTSRALIGEIMSSVAKLRGAAEIIIDGAIRDSAEITKSAFPVYAHAAIHLGSYKNDPEEINEPVTVGGMVVNPGDIIVDDADGIVAFPQNIAEELLKATKTQFDKEAAILNGIAIGQYKGVYSN